MDEVAAIGPAHVQGAPAPPRLIQRRRTSPCSPTTSDYDCWDEQKELELLAEILRWARPVAFYRFDDHLCVLRISPGISDATVQVVQQSAASSGFIDIRGKFRNTCLDTRARGSRSRGSRACKATDLRRSDPFRNRLVRVSVGDSRYGVVERSPLPSENWKSIFSDNARISSSAAMRGSKLRALCLRASTNAD
jgi:hypothetical protein